MCCSYFSVCFLVGFIIQLPERVQIPFCATCCRHSPAARSSLLSGIVFDALCSSLCSLVSTSLAFLDASFACLSATYISSQQALVVLRTAGARCSIVGDGLKQGSKLLW